MGNFENLKNRLQTGDIIVFHTSFNWKQPITYLAAAIRFFAKVRYNHAAVYIKNWNVGFVNEAIGKGLISGLASNRLKNVSIKVLRVYKKDRKSEKETAKRANSLLGFTRYDVIGLWHQLWFQLSGKRLWLGPRTKRAARERMYCYEYVAWVYEELYPDWWKIDLKEILEGDKTFTVFEGVLN